MTLREKLSEFDDTIVAVALHAPDDYAEWQLEYFPTQAAIHEDTISDLKELWNEIRSQIKRDLAKADYVGVKLQEMFDAYDKGDKVEGKKIAWELADLYDINKLR